MKKNVVKNILKAIAATAMVATIFIGSGKEAKAITLDEFAASKGVASCDVFLDARLTDEYLRLSANEAGVDYDDMQAKAAAALNSGFGVSVANELSVKQDKMLNLVNSDRAKNGAGKLAWNADLELIAKQRAYEVYLNSQTAEYANALNTGDYATQAAIVHNGSREGMKENAIVSLYSGVKEATANKSWIDSNGHHVVRINAAYTQYACASYTDPLTGVETWVEVFADNSFKGASSFDYIRYAADYPDLATAFGQDKNALYNHYLTCGKIEGRKAYYTDGTVIGK